MKKLISLAMVVMLAAAVFAGCGTAPAAPEPAPAPAAPAPAAPAAPAPAPEPAPAPQAPPETVNIRWLYTGSTVADDTAVMEAVNKILAEKLNVNLEMIWGTWGDFGERAVLAINGGDNIDIYYTSFADANEYVQYSNLGAYVRLDDPTNDLLAQYAPNYFSGMPDGIRPAMITEGAAGRGIYGVPALKETAIRYVWEFNMNMFNELGLNPDDFTDLYDMGPLLAAAKAAKGADFYPMAHDYTALERMSIPTENLDSLPVLAHVLNKANPSQSGTQIVSRFETPEFAKYVNQMREYYQAGYINPAASVRDTMSTAWTDAKSTGNFLISSRIAAPFHEISESAQFGYTETLRDIVAVNSTNGPRGAIHAISSVSKNPGVALQVLDLVNSDTTVHNLLARGVEGVHYNLENGKIRFTPEKDNYQVWAAGLGRLADLIPTVDDVDPAEWKAGIEKFNQAEASPLMGWLFNPVPVETQMGTLRNVVEEYYPALICGSVDPAVALPEFIQKLKDNGLDTVVTEANTQLQAFRAA
jgi:putative aldouronate transport system substrate-binding protein